MASRAAFRRTDPVCPTSRSSSSSSRWRTATCRSSSSPAAPSPSAASGACPAASSRPGQSLDEAATPQVATRDGRHRRLSGAALHLPQPGRPPTRSPSPTSPSWTAARPSSPLDAPGGPPGSPSPTCRAWPSITTASSTTPCSAFAPSWTTRTSPTACCPRYFTLSQLQRVYEAILSPPPGQAELPQAHAVPARSCDPTGAHHARGRSPTGPALRLPRAAAGDLLSAADCHLKAGIGLLTIAQLSALRVLLTLSLVCYPGQGKCKHTLSLPALERLLHHGHQGQDHAASPLARGSSSPRPWSARRDRSLETAPSADEPAFAFWQQDIPAEYWALDAQELVERVHAAKAKLAPGWSSSATTTSGRTSSSSPTTAATR